MSQGMGTNPLNEVLYAGHLRDAQAVLDAALDALQLDGVVIAAGVEHTVFLDDQHFPFRPNPWFLWLVPPPAAPGSLLHIAPGARPRLLFVAPQDYWHSPPEPPEDPWTGLFDITVVADADAAMALAQQAGGRLAFIGEMAPPSPQWQWNPPQLLTRLEQARCIKSAYEVACIREANHIAVAGHLAAERRFREGGAELDILLAFLGAVRQGENELPYPPIVALNDHAATLHYQRRDTLVPARSLSLLIDAGATCRGYASDITRTWARAPGLFANLVEAMDGVQQELCEAVAPGVDWRELHLMAHRLVARVLRDAGLLRMEPEAALESGVTAAFLPHGLGHLLGLQVHDVGGFRPAHDAEPVPRPPGHPALRLTRRLEPGMVVTVEPGLYFIGSLLDRLRSGPHAGALNWPVIERLAPCGGIRIEDDVVVTTSGHDNLTRTAFADVG
jgi:Xaa-Pro dipeptidase